jgi:hypothetical protein
MENHTRLTPVAKKKDEKLESYYVGKLVKELERQRVFHYKTHGHRMQKDALPDLVCCIDGHFVGIEVKRVGNVLTDKQKRVLREIDASGGIASVIIFGKVACLYIVGDKDGQLTEKTNHCFQSSIGQYYDGKLTGQNLYKKIIEKIREEL